MGTFIFIFNLFYFLIFNLKNNKWWEKLEYFMAWGKVPKGMILKSQEKEDRRI